MKIMVYCWGALREEATIKAFRELPGVEVFSYSRKFRDYHADGESSSELLMKIRTESVDAVFSYDYFPLISMVCDVLHIPYIVWVWDCPQLTTYSVTIKNTCNYLFNFDELFAERIRRLGCPHSYYLPLCADPGLLPHAEKTGRKPDVPGGISFVGSLYTDERNRIRSARFSQYTSGFLEGIIEAQKLIYGFNLIKDTLPEHVIRDVLSECKIGLNEQFFLQDDAQLAADAVGMEVSSRERQELLSALARENGVVLYTGSEVSGCFGKEDGIVKKKGVDTFLEMPIVFRDSRINLNITVKSIEQGIPLRVFDILSCGGFCLTNYQPAVADLFADGEDLVMYTSVEDAVSKAAYYLAHEEERERIARNGKQKVLSEHSFEQRLPQMLRQVFEE